MHWADAFASKLSGDQLVSTGISPSGHIHVGNMREILTGDMIYRASLDAGLKTRFIYLCDDMDPLRKVYPFLSDDYAKYVGKPLFSIPAPDGGSKPYSEYFLAPFLDVLKRVGVDVEVIRTRDLYAGGVFEEAIDMAMNNSSLIRDILEKVSGRKIEGEWSPYNPICSSCGRVNSTSVVSYERPFVKYWCKCGNEDTADIRKAEGKMPWRIEWPAKWFALGVTVEPFGKDHGAPGGSYDTGKMIAERIYKVKAPDYLIYERILLKGKGAMHSSTGNVIPAYEMTEFSPPEILRYLIARVHPNRHIDFDPGNGLLSLIDEFEGLFQSIKSGEPVEEDRKRSLDLSLPSGSLYEEKISFRHLVTLVQIYTTDQSLDISLKRSGVHDGISANGMADRIKVVREWISRYAPESMKFSLLPGSEKVAIDMSQKAILKEFLGKIDSIQWDSSTIHNEIHDIIGSAGLDPKTGFASFYMALIGKDKGPRLGYFLSNLEKDYVRKRLSECSS